MFKIKDSKYFNIDLAYMFAFVDEDEELLKFGVVITAEGNKDLFPGTRAQFHSMFFLEMKPGEIKKWQDIAGKTVEWERYPEEERDVRPKLHVFEFAPVYQGKAEVVTKDTRFFVKVKALCDVTKPDGGGWNREYSGLPLEIEARVRFQGIVFGPRKTEETCKRIIRPYLSDIGDLKYVTNKEGSSYLIPEAQEAGDNMLVEKNYTPYTREALGLAIKRPTAKDTPEPDNTAHRDDISEKQPGLRRIVLTLDTPNISDALEYALEGFKYRLCKSPGCPPGEVNCIELYFSIPAHKELEWLLLNEPINCTISVYDESGVKVFAFEDVEVIDYRGDVSDQSSHSEGIRLDAKRMYIGGVLTGTRKEGGYGY
jgi:hypothetical protein